MLKLSPFCPVLVSLGLSAMSALAESRPNILHIMTDDHSYPHLGCYGDPNIKTPNLDKFASEGMRFDRMYVTCPQCVPSRASIMTGRSPVDIDMSRFSAPLSRDVITYHEQLKKTGYFTGVAGRTFHLDGSGGNPKETADVFEEFHLKTFADRLDFVNTATGSGPIFAQFKEFLDSVPKDKPFDLQLCSNDPHRPLDRNATAHPHDPATLKLPPHYPDTPEIRDDFARYYDEIERFDELFGQIMAELEKRGLTGNTLIAFMGDNGCSQFRGKGTLYEFGIHVPLLMRWPGKIKAGSVSSELISGEDFAPTYLAAAGMEIPKEITGKSFLNLLKGETYTGREYVFAQRGAHGSSLPSNSASFDLGRVVVGKQYKLIYNALWQIPYWPVDFSGDAHWTQLIQQNNDGKLSPELSRMYFSPTRPMFEIYDTEYDIGEFHNLIGKPEIAAEEKAMKAAMQRWMILQRDFLPLPVPSERGGKGKKAH